MALQSDYPLGTTVVSCSKCGQSSTAAEAGWEISYRLQIGYGSALLECPKCGVTSQMRTHQVREPLTPRQTLIVVIECVAFFALATALTAWLLPGWLPGSARWALMLCISGSLTTFFWLGLMGLALRASQRVGSGR